MSERLVTHDGRSWVPLDSPVNPPPVEKPKPKPRPAFGWFPGPGDHPKRMVHDDHSFMWGYAPRTLQMGLKITNEVTRTCPANKAGTRVYPNSKIEIVMKKRRDWLDWILATHGPWATKRILRPGYGYFDGPNENADPLTPENPFKVLLAGGQNVNELFQDGIWSLLETQDFSAGPNYSYVYSGYPHKVLKQCNIGNRTDKSMFIQVDKGEEGGVGDVYLPFCSDVIYPWLSRHPMAAIETALLEPYPSLPFHASYMGFGVMITQYCVQGATVWGYVAAGELEAGWYVLEEMIISGDESDRSLGGNGDDRRVYVSPWMFTSLIPVIGWIRQA
jgi:hypothetical protein